MTEKLSTGSLSRLKKAEGKKRKSPLTPYREKGKGKEGKPGASSTGLFARADAHVKGALLRRHVNAAVEDALAAFCGTRGPAPSDEALWAGFAWKFGVGKFRDLCRKAAAELDEHRSSMPPSKWPSVLQDVLNPFWYARFPKKGPASAGASAFAEATAAALRAMAVKTADKTARQSASALSAPARQGGAR